MREDIRIRTQGRKSILRHLVKSSSLELILNGKLIPFRIDFLVRQRISFRIDFYVRQRANPEMSTEEKADRKKILID